jgi:membrane protein
VLGLVGSVGYVGDRMGSDVVETMRDRVAELAATFLTHDAVTGVILPTFDDVLTSGRFEIVSIGFVLSLWSGSRTLNVFIDTISIMYGLGGHRGIVRTRALSFTLYVASLLVGVVVIPLVLIGPGLVSNLINSWGVPIGSGILASLYWPLVTLQAVLGLATLYHLATPVRTPWRRDVPGALLAVVIWVLSSFVLRRTIAVSVNGPSIYGPLATPIVVLIWLYFLAIAVLIGAALNSALDEMYPHPGRVTARRAGGAFADELPMTPVRQVAEVQPEPRDVRLTP